ncbi:hypothetical protein PLESTB_000357800 [Pleodorina starrii]|uniref:Uncharacterized protein n=1 Tax=Pleodorina starrii TaxID=330485 RepID=A0A9W6BDT4_9CHLO|nr:hypothetical protein PLESTB_000357800 [Pleodorina starrii]GLC64381.1 hypothetical protein PLESTF_000155200 [Pleodorina starrii]
MPSPCGERLCVQRVLQVLLLAVAFVVSAVQVLVYMKWVTVHWEQINGDLARLLGSGSDAAGGAAGGVDVATLVGVASERLAAVMSQGLPSVAGFATGLTLAFMPGMAFA